MRLREAPSFLLATLSLVLGLSAVGCDGGDGSPHGSGDGSSSASGVERSRYLDELSTDELQQLCSWSASILRPGSYSCSNGIKGKAHTASECFDSTRKTPKHCLVSLTEDCVNSTHGDPCLVLTPGPCSDYVSCVLSP